jgi:tRNA-specific 2-thiouridylase
LIVSTNERDLLKEEMSVEKVNWLANQAPKLPRQVKIRTRYHSDAMPAMLSQKNSKTLGAIFKKPQRAITPGQSAAFYDGQEVLGGGIIK